MGSMETTNINDPHGFFAQQAHAEQEAWLAGTLTTYATQDEAEEASYWEYEASLPDPDLAYERHLENLGWEEAERDRMMEAMF